MKVYKKLIPLLVCCISLFGISSVAAQDASKAAPQIYKLISDTLGISIYEVTFIPGAKAAFHVHPDHSVYVLDGGTLDVTDEKGVKTTLELKPGMGLVSQGESHTAMNPGKTTVRAIVTEIRRPRNASLYAQDPVKVAPKVYKKVVLDNDKVRVIQIEFAPGESTPWHHHPNHVAYALTDGKLEITDEGKPSIVAEVKAGDALYLAAVTHMAKNIGTTTLKMVVTELKPAVEKK